MPLNSNPSILDALAGALSSQVTASKTLNPVHLAIATRGYWIQSQILCIPNRYGFFSPGPPRLQVYQAFLSIALLVMIVLDIFLGALVVLLIALKPNNKPIWKFVVVMVAYVGSVVAAIWVLECYSKHRAPDYEWDDWKLRKD